MRNIFQLQKVNGLIIAVGSFSFAGVQFLQMLWLSKEYGANALGMVSIALGFFSPFLSFLAAGQRFSILTNTDSFPRERSIHFLIRISLTLLVLIGFGLFLELIDPDWSPGAGVFVAVGSYKVLDAVLELDAWFKQKSHDVKGFLLITVFRVAPIPIATLLSFLFDLSLYSYLSLASVLLFLCLAANWIGSRLKKESAAKERFCYDSVGAAFGLIFPVGVAAGIESLAVTIPRYYLASFGSLSQVAVFVLFTQISIVFGMVASARLQANIPMYAKLAKTDPDKVRPALLRSLFFLSIAILSISIPVFLVPSKWIAIFFGSWMLEYRGMFFALPLIACVWYVGGYANQVSAIVSGRRYLIASSVLMTFVSVTVMFAGHFIGGNPLVIAFLALSLGFVVRGAFSSLSFYSKESE